MKVPRFADRGTIAVAQPCFWTWVSDSRSGQDHSERFGS